MVKAKVTFTDKNNAEVGCISESYEHRSRNPSDQARMTAQLQGYAQKARGILRRGYFEGATRFTVAVRMWGSGIGEVITSRRTYNIRESLRSRL
jgi:hypothetical protein